MASMLEDLNKTLASIDETLASEAESPAELAGSPETAFYPMKLTSEYSFMVPDSSLQTRKLQLEEALPGTVKQLHGGPRSWRFGFPNGIEVSIPERGYLEVETARHKDAHELMLDDFAGHLVARQLLSKLPQGSQAFRRAGWELPGDVPNSAAYNLLLEVPQSLGTNLLGYTSERQALATWLSIKDIVFGAGIVPSPARAQRDSQVFRIGQKEDAVGTISAATRGSKHGEKALYVVSSNRDKRVSYLNLTSIDANVSPHLSMLAFAAHDLVIRLIGTRDFLNELPKMHEPIKAIHTVSADLDFKRTFRADALQQGSLTAAQYLRQYGEASLRLAERETVSASALEAAQLMIRVADIVPQTAVLDGEFQDLDTELTWASKLASLLKLKGGKLSPATIDVQTFLHDMQYEQVSGNVYRGYLTSLNDPALFSHALARRLAQE